MITPTLSNLEKMAKAAGAILRAGYYNSKKITHKGVIDLVTDIDRTSEEYLLEMIRSDYPQDRVLAEESGENPGKDCRLWLIDPLDGTVNYAHGVPIFSVSIAYQSEGQVQLGVVYDPMRDECFSAEFGRGAWLNDQAIQPSETTSLDQSLLVTGFPYNIRTTKNDNLDNYARLSKLSQGVRRLGSAALDLCYVAAGRFDGYWELDLKPWDIAAGSLIANQAGAQVTDILGNADYLKCPCSVITANNQVHPQLLEALRGT